ncbi:MAG: ribonuclease J [Syntrophaceticus sp.]|nr:ribonuclease J [Syntrophaceticus sp.]MDD3313925.1 ribonuclease J [Syntrophaceticus sp.]MDD4359003.1 ribonuclease J [Syntrophaceticus sp.]MDD4782230.1 ribonuclease J [Syntrophaceticus sp.]
MKTECLKIIPLGGLGEIGKNIMAIRYKDDMIVIDGGLMFPDDEMLGIDLVIPDITYLVENKKHIRGIILTHGHEDHIGGLPYILRQINAPIYGTKLTLGLLAAKLEEGDFDGHVETRCVHAGQRVKLGPFNVEFIRVSHSIADAVALGIRTPVGMIVHTGDFKFDQTPVNNQGPDYHKFAELGKEGILVLMSDSTNAERPGYTLSERVVADTFDETFRNARERIIIASFASNIHRIQLAITTAAKYNKKVAVVGRSMVNVVNIATELGYLDIPPGSMIDIDDIDQYPKNKIAVLTTGSQGEPMSALTRMANCEHRNIEIIPGDTVIISASPIPGNEKMINKTIDRLFKQGAEVIYESVSGVHVSGHASQEELKLMINLTKPKFFIPIHGEYRHLIKHAQLAKDVGISNENVFVVENGQILEFCSNWGKVAGRVTAGRVLVDGLGVGDVGNIVLRDRRQLSRDGLVVVVLTLDQNSGEIVAGPDIISRGFVYVRESEDLLEEARKRINATLKVCELHQTTEWGAIKSCVRETVGKFFYERTGRRPMILPIIMDV